MKRLVLLAALLLSPSILRAQVVLQWDYDTSKDSLCSATVTDDCVKEFGVGIVINGVVTQIATVVPSSCTSGTPTVVCTTPAMPAPPNRKYKLNTYVAWAVTSDGFKSPNSNTVDVQVKPGSPGNLRVP